MTLTPQSRLSEVIVQVLETAGGSASRATVLHRMASALQTEFTDEDLEPVETRPHEAKWQNRASFERASMVRDGVLATRDDGVWSLTSGRHGPGTPIGATTSKLLHCGQWQPIAAEDCYLCGHPLEANE